MYSVRANFVMRIGQRIKNPAFDSSGRDCRSVLETGGGRVPGMPGRDTRERSRDSGNSAESRNARTGMREHSCITGNLAKSENAWKEHENARARRRNVENA